MDIKSPNITINLGNYETASKRRESYQKAMKRDDAKSLNDWCKRVLDRASGYKE